MKMPRKGPFSFFLFRGLIGVGDVAIFSYSFRISGLEGALCSTPGLQTTLSVVLALVLENHFLSVHKRMLL